MPDLQQLTQAIIQFRDERDWKQFHKPIVITLMLESAEVAELFQWKTDEEMDPAGGQQRSLVYHRRKPLGAFGFERGKR